MPRLDGKVIWFAAISLCTLLAVWLWLSRDGSGDSAGVLSVSNKDGPPILVTAWRGADEVAVACAEGKEIDGTDRPSDGWHVKVVNANTAETLFDGPISFANPGIAVRAGGAVLVGDAPPRGPPGAPGACDTPGWAPSTSP